MMKSFKYHIIGLVFIVLGLVACEYSQDVEPVVSPDGYPHVTVTPVEAYSAVKEGDTIYFNVTSEKMLDRALTFDVSIVDGDADELDYISTAGVIAPYSTSGQVMVIFPQDWDVEGTENVSFEIGVFSTGERYLVHPSTENPVFDLTIANYISDVLTVQVGWSQEVTGMEIVGGEVELPNGDIVEWVDTVEAVYDAGDGMDFDILISPAEDFDPADPWASEIGNYSGATGNNPEVVEAILEDGEYIIWADLYSNALSYTLYSFDDSTLFVPMFANFQRQGTSMSLDVAQDEEQAPFVWTPGYDEGGNFQGVIAKIVVADGLYTIVDYEDDTEYGAARKSAKAKTPRPALLKK